jgi:hypothetical protein
VTVDCGFFLGFFGRWLTAFAGWGCFFFRDLGLRRVPPGDEQDRAYQDGENRFEAQRRLGSKKGKVDFHAAFSLIASRPRYQSADGRDKLKHQPRQ